MLTITLLGQFELRLNGVSLDVAAGTLPKLCAYLVLHAGQSVSRAKLAGLLWPEVPEPKARKHLRHYIWRLRQAIGEEFLISDRETVTFATSGDYRLDVELLQKDVGGDDVAGLIANISTYQGEFMPGHYDDWIQRERDRMQAILHEQMRSLLAVLIAEGRWPAVVKWSEHWLSLGEAPEAAYRALMVGHAKMGELARVAQVYRRCQRALHDELGVTPSTETQKLFAALSARERAPDQATFKPAQAVEAIEPFVTANRDAIRQNVDAARDATSDHRYDGNGATIRASHLSRILPVENVRLPAFLQETADRAKGRHPDFVNRHAELAHLHSLLERARGGQQSVAFLAGDAGSGKSSLLRAFTAGAGDRFPDLLVAWGTCNAFGGRGDPYLPFRQTLSMLTGDVAPALAAGTITVNQARRLWRSMPAATDALLHRGPNLLDVLVPAPPLWSRLQSAFPEHALPLDTLTEMASALPTSPQERPQLFEQVAAVLRQIAEEHTVVLALDDVQWADRDSLNLLFHLARSLTGAPILLLATYRSDAVSSDEEHPLRPLLHETRRLFGDVWLDLDEAPGRTFVDALLDREANHLGEAFRASLCNLTGGHPLYTVELLRDMQERGDLIRRQNDAWTAEPSLDWEKLPAKVAGAIESRIGRLHPSMRDILTAAAVEGEVFTAAVVARVCGVPERDLRRTLSKKLERGHRLIQEHEFVTENGYRHVRYRFAHALFQHYLYHELTGSARRLLHGDVATALEALYGDRLDEIAGQLAHHYLCADAEDKALPYLLKAGDRARRLYAFADAQQHYNRAITILKEQGAFEAAGRVLMKLGLTYHGAVDFESASHAFQEGFVMLRQGAGRYHRLAALPAPPHPLRISSREVAVLDPMQANDLASFRVVHQLFGRLLTFNQDFDVVPDMAKRWEIFDEGKTYQFTLRDDLLWSDGQPVTAADFVFRLQRELAPSEGTSISHAQRWFDIVGAVSFHRGEGSIDDLGIEIPDPRTVRLRLENPSGNFLHNLVHLVPIPRHVVRRHGVHWAESNTLVSCGPYLLESWDREHSLVLRRNSLYYGNYRGNVERIELRFFADNLDAIAAYEADTLDIIELVPELQGAISHHATDYLTWPAFVITKANFNTCRPPFDDLRVRRALTLAIDRYFLANVAGKGLVSPATGGYVPLGLPGHRPDIAPKQNLEAARRLMAEAGYPQGSGAPPVKALTKRGYYGHIVEPLNYFWEEGLGLNIEWELVESREYDQRLEEGEIDLFVEGLFAPTTTPDDFMSNFAIPRQYWQGEEFRRLVARARRVSDPAARLRLFQQAEDILLEEMPLLPLYYWQQHLLVKPWVRSYRPTMLFLESWSDVVIEPH